MLPRAIFVLVGLVLPIARDSATPKLVSFARHPAPRAHHPIKRPFVALAHFSDQTGFLPVMLNRLARAQHADQSARLLIRAKRRVKVLDDPLCDFLWVAIGRVRPLLFPSGVAIFVPDKCFDRLHGSLPNKE